MPIALADDTTPTASESASAELVAPERETHDVIAAIEPHDGTVTFETAAYIEQVRTWNQAVWYGEIARQMTAEYERVERVIALRRAQQSTPRTDPPAEPDQPPLAVTPSYGAGACGGDLPPCWVMNNESGGNLTVWNGGCYYPIGYAGNNPCGSTASGKWQFIRSTWAGYGGYLNAADAPEHVQDEKARLTWAGGRGCGHWSAC